MAKKKTKTVLKQKVVSKRILKKGKRIVVRIPEYRNEPYVPIYMKEAIKEDKRQFFFK